MTVPSTPNWTAAKALVETGIMAEADRTTMTSIARLRTTLTSARVLNRPGILFTTSAHVLGDYEELRRLAPSDASEIAELGPWKGMSEADIAKLILDDVADTYARFVHIGLTLGVRRELGDTETRCMLSFERVGEFVSSLYERSFGEAVQ